MNTIAAHLQELAREYQMRLRVYPGLVKQGKMTQPTADKKAELIRSVASIFSAAIQQGVDVTDLRLPITIPEAGHFPITTLAPHIKEAESEIAYRIKRINRLSGATKEIAKGQLNLMRQILAILQHIQTQHNSPTSQGKLF